MAIYHKSVSKNVTVTMKGAADIGSMDINYKAIPYVINMERLLELYFRAIIRKQLPRKFTWRNTIRNIAY